MTGRKTENQNGLKYKIERKPQGNIEIPAVFAYDIVAASKKPAAEHEVQICES